MTKGRPANGQACACTILCRTHAAAPTLLAEMQRIKEIIGVCHEQLSQISVFAGPPRSITRDEAIGMLRRFETDLDLYGELTIHTLEAFRLLLAQMNDAPYEPPKDCPF